MRRRDTAVRPNDPVADRLVAVALCLAALAPAAAGAQTQRSGNDAARVMQQLQQISAERVVLQADKSRLEQEVADLKAKLAAAAGAPRVDPGATQRALAAEAKERQAAGELERVRAQTQELVTRFRETAQALKDAEGERNRLRGEAGAKGREIATCIDRNVGLYELNGELLARLERRRAESREPFLQLKRTELENLIDDYRYRVDELRVQRAAAPVDRQSQ